ncbi:(deoxy)nucleoside triphosphate pyrophosphohydrolase [Brevibacterium luteolum]|uniref:(deoxy)nucleoside triphosphate pyrophosphohydrolase n=1 Tax=Brevibacterium luteolum TaxID=199591 RepID=UPI001C233128|nr:(deoxy)nucleoside triphosphate pyrophosphohydrolase [Brevibacterium luteolum]MBU8579767.1 (deoxy)nucleoside triphosphate pyrophosphohydrolase [Brevibacterium luteolum]
MSDPIIVVGAIFSRGEQILACRRAPHKAAAGKWEFPGGKVEDGEQPQAALARELNEELGISAEVGELLVRETTPTSGAAIDLACYWVTAAEAPVASADHDALVWVDREQIASLDWAEPDLPAVELLRGGAASGAHR